MFRKLHIQMTLFSLLITSAILVVMTLACLGISENGIAQNRFTSFENNVNSCLIYLETQNVLDHQWIQQAKQEYEIDMEIRDNGNTLFFDKLHPSQKAAERILEAIRISRESEGLDVERTGSLALTKTAIFQTEEFYACTALVPKGEGLLSVVMVYPLENLKRQLVRQRITFGAVVAAAIMAMAVFSWFFTKRMLLPLEKSRKKQTEFIASASHELRSPLTVILSSIQAMEATPEESGHYIQTIKKEGNRMARLIGDMLELANADNKSWSMLLSPCELDTLVLDTYERYEPLMKEKKLRLRVELPEEPLAACRCDSSRMAQVLGILLDNAASYVQAGGWVRLGVREREKDFLIFVADNGPGISDESKESVFERFYRADKARNDKQHFGLGLCIAREIVSLHHGSIRIEDTPGGGATFVILLPK